MTVPATTASLGTVWTYPNNPRVAKAAIAAAYNGVGGLEYADFTMGATNRTPEFLAKFPLGKVPAFESADGKVVLYESRAILNYVTSAKADTTLFGKTREERALVEQWLSVADNEWGPVATAWLYPLFGYMAYNEATTSKAKADARKLLGVLDAYLLSRTFLVGQAVTLADITLATVLMTFYKTVWDAEFRAPYTNVNRWFITCVNQPQFKAVLGEVALCTEPMKPKAPEPVVAKETAQPAKKAAPAVTDTEALEAAAAEEEKAKAKNPLDLLPKSSFVLDEWKRFYSNNDTRPTAVDWFWKNYDAAGYSMWKVDYKYNQELSMTFMSSNLIGGFFQRLESVRKYAFGSLLVCGKDNDSVISGYFVFRGSEIPEGVLECPDYESFSFVKVNDADPKVREAFNAVIAWDATIAGKPFADGKIYK